MVITPPIYKDKLERSSNLELYRIICMLLIVAHHYVINSGLIPVMKDNLQDANSYFLYAFGMWGKVGINCFIMITGYFMCRSRITLKKFLKLLLEIYFYRIVIFLIFLIAGYETISLDRIVRIVVPVMTLKDNFTSCFIVFYLTIPFLNILVSNMSQKQHIWLLILSLGLYTIMGTIPGFRLSFNYVTWFGIIYFIASYIRIYPNPLFERKNFWGIATLLLVLLSILTVYAPLYIRSGYPFHFVIDCNKLLAVAVAIASFLWFKNLNIPQSKFINLIGGSTFGVLLIHAQSDAMRTWLWKDVADCIGHFSLPFYQLVIYSTLVVLSIFSICILIDRIRIKVLEEPFFKWYDKKYNK